MSEKNPDRCDVTPLPKQAVVAVIRKGDCYLVIKRSREVIAPGKICFPGGSIEPGETEVEALHRELREELSATVEIGRKIWTSVTPWGITVHWYTATPLTDDFSVDPAEVQWCRWMDKVEFECHDQLLASNKAFVDALAADEFSLD